MHVNPCRRRKRAAALVAAAAAIGASVTVGGAGVVQAVPAVVYGPPVDYATGSTPTGIAVADLQPRDAARVSAPA
jgi:hypothetical protein